MKTQINKTVAQAEFIAAFKRLGKETLVFEISEKQEKKVGQMIRKGYAYNAVELSNLYNMLCTAYRTHGSYEAAEIARNILVTLDLSSY